jgi:predicted neutral ceramidase superfamily lipid hydrolase
MEYWDISVDMMLKFRTEDIPQIRIMLANDLYFSEKNTEDKSLVRNMFLQVFCDSIWVVFLWALIILFF